MSDLGLKFSQSVRKRCMNSCAKNGGAPRRRFPAICEKPEGGGVFKHPPGPARNRNRNRNRLLESVQLSGYSGLSHVTYKAYKAKSCYIQAYRNNLKLTGEYR